MIQRPGARIRGRDLKSRRGRGENRSAAPVTYEGEATSTIDGLVEVGMDGDVKEMDRRGAIQWGACTGWDAELDGHVYFRFYGGTKVYKCRVKNANFTVRISKLS